MAQPSYTIDEFRFQQDAGSDVVPLWEAAANTDITLEVGSANTVLIRFQLHNDNAKAGNGEAFDWEYSHESGTWTPITTATNVIRAVNATPASMQNGQDCGNRLTSQTPSFVSDNNGYCGDGTGTGCTFTASYYSETALCFYIPDTVDVDNLDDIEIRIVEQSGDTITYGSLTANITVSKGTALTKILDETVNVDETILNPRVLARLISDTVNVDEEILRLAVYVRLIDETVNIDEAIDKLLSLTRAIDETVNIGETVSRLFGIVRAVDETVNIDESISRLFGIVRLVAETVNVDEVVIKLRDLVRLADETVNIDEVVIRTRDLIRLAAEVINLNEVIVRSRSMLRVIDDTVNSNEAIIRLLGFVRVVDETINIGETIVDILSGAAAALPHYMWSHIRRLRFAASILRR